MALTIEADDDDSMSLPPSVVARANLAGVPSPSLQSLVTVPEGLTAERAGIQRSKIAETGGIIDRSNARMEEDRARMIKANEASGVESGNLRPWDADAAREKFRTDPLESFGSLGSVFAMIASAFTHAPMTNALNASAAAMHAIKDGNDAEYEKAFRAFKENNDLVVKRHAMMQQQYNNAAKLMDTDMTSGRIELQNAATKYGDQQLLTLLNAGMDKEVFDLLHSRNTNVKDQIEINKSLFSLDESQDKAVFQKQAFNAIRKTNAQEIQDPNQRAAHDLAAFNRIYGAKQDSPAQAILGNYLLENPNATAEQIGDFAVKNHLLPYRSGAAGVQQQLDQLIQMKEKEFLAAGMSPAAAKEKAIQEAMVVGQKLGTGVSAEQAQFIRDRTQKYIDEGKDKDTARELALQDNAKANQKPGVLTDARYKADLVKKITTKLQLPKAEGGEGLDEIAAAKKAQMQVNALTPAAANHIEAVTSVTNQIDYALKILKDAGNLNPTGLSGVGVRFGEWAGFFGKDREETAHAYQQVVNNIKGQLASALPGATRARLLKQDREDLDTIVPGLGKLADRKASIEGLERLKKIINKVDLLEGSEEEVPSAKPVSPQLKALEDAARARGLIK